MVGISSAPRANDPRSLPKVDIWLVLSTLVLLTVGLMALYSEGLSRDGGADFRKQLVFAAIGLIPFAVFATVSPKIWMWMRHPLYVLNLLALSAVFVLGSRKKGAERWIEVGPIQFQPSEMAKLLTILTLAAFFAANIDAIRKPATFLKSLLHILPPLALILLQPHLGAAMVIVASWFAISIVAGVPLKYLVAAFAVLLVMGGTVLFVPAVSDRVLHGYQHDRIEGLTSNDVKGRNWQTERAEIAFGVGGLTGAGYLMGEQKKAHFIPEQHNDFVFTVVGEEGGLIGCTLVLAAFGFFFYRIWLVMFHADEPFYRMVTGGIFAALFFHTFVNIAMVLQLVPVVGLWLPFLSYGGTALWLCMACVGLLLNIRRRERAILF